MLRTPEETALLIAVIFSRSEQTRARMGGNTIRIVSGRMHLRGAFMSLLVDALAQYGVGIMELPHGGFGLVQTRALEAARSISARRQLTEDERRSLRTNRINWGNFDEELNTETPETEE